MKPLVSVLIPTRQRVKLLQLAIDSVCAQTCALDRIEVIVVHDGKDDSATAREFALPRFMPRVKYFSIEKGGLSAAINAAFRQSAGEYVTVLADDDLMKPHKIELLAGMLDRDASITGAYALGERCSFGRDLVTPRKTSVFVPQRNIEWLRRHPRVTWDTIKAGHGCLIHGTAIVHRRSSWQRAGLWDETLWAGEEWEYHLRLLSVGAVFEGVESVTDTYRVHGSQKSNVDRTKRDQQRKQLLRAISEKYLALAKEA